MAVAASRLEPPPRGGTRPRSVSVDVPVLDISCYGTLRDVFRDWLLSLNTMTSRSLHLSAVGLDHALFVRHLLTDPRAAAVHTRVRAGVRTRVSPSPGPTWAWGGRGRGVIWELCA